jgi:hypothetical protein
MWQAFSASIGFLSTKENSIIDGELPKISSNSLQLKTIEKSAAV